VKCGADILFTSVMSLNQSEVMLHLQDRRKQISSDVGFGLIEESKNKLSSSLPKQV
jgi:hypothetical protein